MIRWGLAMLIDGGAVGAAPKYDTEADALAVGLVLASADDEAGISDVTLVRFAWTGDAWIVAETRPVRSGGAA